MRGEKNLRHSFRIPIPILASLLKGQENSEKESQIGMFIY